MTNKLILDFPVLQKDGGDFLEGVLYEVEASRLSGAIKVEHVLKGNSFIRQLVKSGGAKFSVSLLYRDSSERQFHSCNDNEIIERDSEIVAIQKIPVIFSYAPEISPSIVIMEDGKFSVDSSFGLDGFWETGSRFDIPKYARIALAQKLKFTSGDVSSLIRIEFEEKFGDGEMSVSVNENAGEGETPVVVLCGKGVYGALVKAKQAEPSDLSGSLRSAIVTQALCAVYGYMQKLGNEYETGGVLAAHLEVLESETNLNWEHENFDPCLAATKMRPYFTSVLNGEGNHD